MTYRLYRLFLILSLCIPFFSCSKDEEVRTPEDILGVWSPSDSQYLEFGTDHRVHNLRIYYQDGMSIGDWVNDVYFYEPGYNLVIYITDEMEADVYEIVELNSKKLTWCPVDKIDPDKLQGGTQDIGKVIGEIINKAQEGYKLNPELYQSLRKISQNEFFSILERLDIEYPWDF